MDQCVILVGGKGSRLGEITAKFPKPMLEVNDEPFLFYLIKQAKSFGFKKILLLAGHASEQIENYINNLKLENISIDIKKEQAPLGTGGALVNAYNYLDNEFFLMNGDSIIDGNWLSINKFLDDSNDIAIALVKMKDCRRYGTVSLKDNKVTDFIEKNNSSDDGLINGGVYFIKKKIFKGLRVENLSFENDILPFHVKRKKVAGKEIKGFFIDIGIPESLEQARQIDWKNKKKAVIFDRDGTLNIDDGYTHKISELRWKDGAIELLKFLNDSNILVLVATNQAGIAKGIFREADMHNFHREMQNQLRIKGAHIDSFYFCPYHIDGEVAEYKRNSKDRKPNTGMLEKISHEFSLQKKNMLMIGDRDTDTQCANNFMISSILYNGMDNLMTLRDNIKEKLQF
tara:strand:+ start:8862 stop:10061 length:1200 start_codon:yes stop_codon:yes gene_type:complete